MSSHLAAGGAASDATAAIDAGAEAALAADTARARTDAAEAAQALAMCQGEERARESARGGRLEEVQRAVARNAELAGIDADAARASGEALRYRLAGKQAQAAMLHGQLVESRGVSRLDVPTVCIYMHVNPCTYMWEDAIHAHLFNMGTFLYTIKLPYMGRRPSRRSAPRGWRHAALCL